MKGRAAARMSADAAAREPGGAAARMLSSRPRFDVLLTPVAATAAFSHNHNHNPNHNQACNQGHKIDPGPGSGGRHLMSAAR